MHGVRPLAVRPSDVLPPSVASVANHKRDGYKATSAIHRRYLGDSGTLLGRRLWQRHPGDQALRALHCTARVPCNARRSGLVGQLPRLPAAPALEALQLAQEVRLASGSADQH